MRELATSTKSVNTVNPKMEPNSEDGAVMTANGPNGIGTGTIDCR